MEAFVKHTGTAVVIDRPNIDTDQIIPKQFLKRIERTGFGKFLFYDWRFTSAGETIDTFVLNDPKYLGASILIAGENFGCGSSREHAPWSLLEYGFRVIIAPSFADIFYNNSFKSGLLPIALDDEIVTNLAASANVDPGYALAVDLENQTISDSAGVNIPFAVDAFRKQCLINGLDDIGLTLQNEPSISAYESAHLSERAFRSFPMSS